MNTFVPATLDWDPWWSPSATNFSSTIYVQQWFDETPEDRAIRELFEEAERDRHVRAILRSARRPDRVPPPMPLAPIADPPPVLLVRSRGQAPRRAA